MNVGDSLKPLEKAPFTRQQLLDYADAASDHNPIHVNPEFAKNVGFPDVIVHGMLSMAMLADFMAFNFPEEAYKVSRFRVRFRKVTFPGDTIRCEGTVKKILSPSKYLVHIWSQNQKGDVTTDGEAEVSTN